MMNMKEQKKNWLVELLPYIVILIVVVIIRTFFVTPVRVNGESMVDTLNGGEIMILNKLGEIKRYSMVVADIVVDKKRDDTIIKRVYGLPNEKIKCENGIIYINDRKIDDTYAYGTTFDFDEVKLGDDEYFLLGDNRIVSLDSRYVGPVKRSKIEGTTSFIIWPFKKFGKVE